MASLRALFIITNEKKVLFSRKFPTVELRLSKQMDQNYVAIPNDKVFANLFFDKVIKEDLIQDKFKYTPYNEDLNIDNEKMEELIEDVEINVNLETFNYYSECPIVSLSISKDKELWPCVYLRKSKIYCLALPFIEYHVYKDILNENKDLSLENRIFKAKKLYEEQDLSIVCSFKLLENLINYITQWKTFEEMKLQILISNMCPFGNILDVDFNQIVDTLSYLNQKTTINYSSIEKEFANNDNQRKTPGWLPKLPSGHSNKLKITIKEELKNVVFRTDLISNTLLVDIMCLADLKKNCEITMPIKEINTNYLHNMRIHSCAKLEDQNLKNETIRLLFIPPQIEFKMGVFEIENLESNKLPFLPSFNLKESSQNEVKLYLQINLDLNIINKFEYFYIDIPLGHFGIISKTKIMVQVGEVSLKEQGTTLHWDLGNKVSEKTIVLSGTVNFYVNEDKKEEKSELTSGRHVDVFFSKSKETNSDKNIHLDDYLRIREFKLKSHIMKSNCFCKIFFKLTKFSISNIIIDTKSISFYPKISPWIEIKNELYSHEFIVWNNLSFSQTNFENPQKADITLLKINVDN